jgi:hypothetical protein
LLCSQECKLRLHRCYRDTLCFQHSLRRCLSLWHLYALKISSARTLLSSASVTMILRRVFVAWNQMVRVLSFTSRRHLDSNMKLKRSFFGKLKRLMALSICTTESAERMRASARAASHLRLLHHSWKSLLLNVVLSKQSIKSRETDEIVQLMALRQCLCKPFKNWAVVSRDHRLRDSQQVIF